MTTITRQQEAEMLETFRLQVLGAMDKAMNILASRSPLLLFPDDCTGARDADLPVLFQAIDAQFRRNLKHAGIEAVIGAPGDYTVL